MTDTNVRRVVKRKRTPPLTYPWDMERLSPCKFCGHIYPECNPKRPKSFPRAPKPPTNPGVSPLESARGKPPVHQVSIDRIALIDRAPRLYDDAKPLFRQGQWLLANHPTYRISARIRVPHFSVPQRLLYGENGRIDSWRSNYAVEMEVKSVHPRGPRFHSYRNQCNVTSVNITDPLELTEDDDEDDLPQFFLHLDVNLTVKYAGPIEIAFVLGSRALDMRYIYEYDSHGRLIGTVGVWPKGLKELCLRHWKDPPAIGINMVSVPRLRNIKQYDQGLPVRLFVMHWARCRNDKSNTNPLGRLPPEMMRHILGFVPEPYYHLCWRDSYPKKLAKKRDESKPPDAKKQKTEK